MARVKVTVPDDPLGRARGAALNVSRLAAAALTEELDRRAKLAALDGCLRELAAELGSVPDRERLAAEEWAADRVLGRSELPAANLAARTTA